MLETLKTQWLQNPKADLMAGGVVALALIPEAIAFSIIAGVDPAVGLYASFCIAVVTALAGGRPGMISAATGAMALVAMPLVRDHGLSYLLAATLLTGVIQIAFGSLRLGRYMRFVPKAVMTGFVNSLAVLIFMAQLPQLEGGGVLALGLVALGLAIIYGLPRLTTAIPSPMVAIVVVTALCWTLKLDVRTVGDLGALPEGLPVFALPQVPLTWETLEIITPTAFALALVGLIESLLTAKIIDEMTDTDSCRHVESRGQGIANIVAGLFGGMAGCAMIGQSVINVKSGGRGRLSTLVAGLFLLVLVVGLGELVAQIPMAALVAVMFMVSLSTFDWSSLKRMTVMPRSEAIVLVVTVAVVITTHDLSKGVIAGVLLSALFFARVVAKLIYVTETYDEADDTQHIRVSGQLFFASVESFLELARPREGAKRMVVDFTASHVWDESAVAAIDKLVLAAKGRGMETKLVGLNEASASLLTLSAQHDKPGAAVGHH
ncbi:MAG: SulP family inorganic anion transporter [Bradymonadia bacterium]